MAYINIYKLEEFFYNHLKSLMEAETDLTEVYKKFGPNGLPVEEVFADMSREEEAGKRFEYNIRGFIIGRAWKYKTIYQQARKRALTDFFGTYKAPNRKEYGEARKQKRRAINSSSGRPTSRVYRK